MSEYDTFKEKDKQPGVAVGKLVEIIEPTSKADVELAAKAKQDTRPEYQKPDAYIVRRIFKYKGVEVALLVDDNHADIPEIEIQRFIAHELKDLKEPDLSKFFSPEQLEIYRATMRSVKARAQHPLRAVWKVRYRGDAILYLCATAFLRPKTLHS